MAATPEALKQEIEATRADLAANVDALAEKVTPGPATRKVGLFAAVAGLLLVALRPVARRRKRKRGSGQ